MDEQIHEHATTRISDDDVVKKMLKGTVDGELTTVADVAAAISSTVLGTYNLNWQFELEQDYERTIAVRQTSVSPGWPKFGLLLFILAPVSPRLVPWFNRGAPNLGESQ